jgi:uncharacterized lipoprotein YehR (DUF1307 family)
VILKMKKQQLILGLVTIIGLSGCGNSNDENHLSNEKTNHEEKNHEEKSHEGNHNVHEKSSQQDTTQIKWNFEGNPQSEKSNLLTIQVNDKNGKPINDFEVEHEKLMHLIVVSKDLSHFDHIHPDYKGDGKFTVTSNFPTGGEYKLYADYMPKGSSKVVKTEEVHVGGTQETTLPLKEEKLTKVVDGKEVTLSFDHLRAGMELNVTFNIKDTKTKKQISDLQPYLGAVGHVVIISGDTNTYLHVHPMDEQATGPDAKFMTTFPKRGVYKIWGQFQQNGKVFTVPFTVNVPK